MLRLFDDFRWDGRRPFLDLPLRLFRIILSGPIHVCLHVDHLNYFGEHFPIGLATGGDHGFSALNGPDRLLQPPALLLDCLALAPQSRRQIRFVTLENVLDLAQGKSDEFQGHNLFEPGHVALAIKAITSVRIAAWLQQPQPVVMVQRPHGDPGQTREFTCFEQLPGRFVHPNALDELRLKPDPASESNTLSLGHPPVSEAKRLLALITLNVTHPRMKAY